MSPKLFLILDFPIKISYTIFSSPTHLVLVDVITVITAASSANHEFPTRYLQPIFRNKNAIWIQTPKKRRHLAPREVCEKKFSIINTSIYRHKLQWTVPLYRNFNLLGYTWNTWSSRIAWMNLSLLSPTPHVNTKTEAVLEMSWIKKIKPMDNVQNTSQAYCVQQAALLHFTEVYTRGIHCLLSSGHMRLMESKPTSFLCETVMALLSKHAHFTHFPLFNSHSDLILYNVLYKLWPSLGFRKFTSWSPNHTTTFRSENPDGDFPVYLRIWPPRKQATDGKEAVQPEGHTNISLMKRQFVVNHTVRETEISSFIDSWVTNTPVKMLCPHKKLIVLTSP